MVARPVALMTRIPAKILCAVVVIRDWAANQHARRVLAL
jgi:hypothetical protein